MMAAMRWLLLIFITAFSSLFVTSLVYAVRSGIRHGVAHYNDYPLWLNSFYWSASIIVGLTVIGGTFLGEYLGPTLFPYRKRSLREEEQTNPLLERVQTLYLEKFGRAIKPKVLMMDLPHINGVTFGRRTIAMSSGLLKAGTDDEISAIIAHEIGHLRHRDGCYNMALFVASYPTVGLHRLIWDCFVPTKPKEGEKPEKFSLLLATIVAILIFCFGIIFFLSGSPAFPHYG